MATRVERAGIEGCIKKVNEAITDLETAAQTIEGSMGDLPEYWEGAAYDKAQEVYENDYQTLLTKTLPEAVKDFRNYINQCKDKIIEIDEKLAGK